MNQWYRETGDVQIRRTPRNDLYEYRLHITADANGDAVYDMQEPLNGTVIHYSCEVASGTYTLCIYDEYKVDILNGELDTVSSATAQSGNAVRAMGNRASRPMWCIGMHQVYFSGSADVEATVVLQIKPSYSECL